MLNFMVYDVDFTYGTIIEYAVNVIAENVLTQVDKYSYTLTLMEGIIEYNKDEKYVYKECMYVLTKCGMKKTRKTTVVWNILVQQKNKSEYWINLEEMKESHPV